MIEPYYDRGGITIYHGDCAEVMNQLGEFDLLLTDPPYGIERFKKAFGTSRFYGHGCDKSGIEWDNKPSQELFDAMLSMSKNAIVWGANNFKLPVSEYFLVWDKMQTVTNFASAELAYTNIKCPARVYRFSIHQHNKTHKMHPTQKPVSLMRWCLGIAGDVSTVFDPFMGSGTTLLACKLEGISCVGIEREEAYCEAAVKRLAQEVLF